MARELLPAPPCLRTHPALPYFADGRRAGTWLAMVAALTGPGGELLALHRIRLTPDGRKAPDQGDRRSTALAPPDDRGGRHGGRAGMLPANPHGCLTGGGWHIRHRPKRHPSDCREPEEGLILAFMREARTRQDFNPRPPKPQAETITAGQAAALLGVTREWFLTMRDEAWLPKPVMLHPAGRPRWVRAELLAALADRAPRVDPLLNAPAARARRAGKP